MRSRFVRALLVCVVIAGFALHKTDSAKAVSNGVVISQVYGGGGNAGATWTNDFIELFNRGTSSVSLGGMSVQYASAAGTTWQVTPLTNVTLQPGQYYLIQEAVGAGGTQTLPTADATGTIPMSATAGKVALVSTTSALSGACPVAIDFLGYASGATNPCFEGTVGPGLTNTTAAFRANAGCTDTDVNGSDFTTATPSPRNTASPLHACQVLTTPPSGTFAVSPSSLNPGDPFTATVTVTPGTNAVLSVSADLSAINLGTQTFSSAGSNTYTFSGAIPSGVTGGVKTLTATITDTSAPPLTASPQTAVTILTHSAPTATGAANPGTVAPNGTTSLTVTVTSGTNPASTGITVTGDLSAIGGSASQAFTDNGNNSFSYAATVAAGTPDGNKSIPITIADAQGASSQAVIALNVGTPFVAPSVKISQVFGGGGNSGATYLNDFVELFNAGTSPVDVTAWSVQEASASSSTWSVAPLCPSGTCVIQPGHYFLLWESKGTGTSVQVPLPAADATGVATVSATDAKFALMGNTTPLSGSCAVGPVVDFVGYGSANCSEASPAPKLSNTTADVRKGNGCLDTDDNGNDFLTVTPVPRNSASAPHICGDSSTLRALGLASPTGPERGGLVNLMVQVTPASAGPASGFSVVADLSAIGGGGSQPFFDDGTSGDLAPADNTFSYQVRVPFTLAKGVHTIVATVSDGQGTSLNEPITFTVALPTCGTERWAVKVGDDAGASLVDLTNPPTPTTIGALRGVAPPTLNPNAPYDPRFTGFSGVEMTAWVLNATMTAYKKETDVDYHLVIADTSETMIAEIPEPDCASDASPFRAGILKARQTFDAQLTATPDFQSVSLPVRLTGVGFFDFLHGQNGVAPNGVELHPVLDVIFQSTTTTTLGSSANPSKYQDDVVFTATVSSPGASPTGDVSFFDGGTSLGIGTLDANGHASVHTSGLSVGPHSITAKYQGDANSTPSGSTPFMQDVGKADQTITFDAIPDKTFGDGDFTIAASSTSGIGVTLTRISGPVTLAGDTVHLTGAGSVTIRASQDGDSNYSAAATVDRSFTIAKANQAIHFNGPAPAPRYGALPFDVTATGGASGMPVTFTANGACTVQGQNGIATVTIASAGDCHVVASQAGNDNFTPAPDVTATITIGRATAEIDIDPVTVGYDGQAHGLMGEATGVKGEDLTALLTLGAKFTNVPGGTANWSFAGNMNYLPFDGHASVSITKATPVFSNLSALTVEAGTVTAALGGSVALGTLIPTGSVTITFNGTPQMVAVGPDGRFAASFPAATLVPSATPYAVSFTYSGDGNFNPIAGAGSVRVVDTTPPAIVGVSATPNLLESASHRMVDVMLSYQATDVGSAPSCGLSVVSNEPVNGTGDGDTASDWMVIDEHHVRLRAERAGTGSGRLYTITVGCSDAAGNRSTATTTVSVPK
jgi:hypothetical protein